MTATPPEAELRDVVERWRRSMLDGDVATLAELREDGYVAELPGGAVLSKEDELRLLGGEDTDIRVLRIGGVEIAVHGHEADVKFDCRLEGRVAGDDVFSSHTMTLVLRKQDGAWRARRASMRLDPGPRSLGRRLALAARARAFRLRTLASPGPAGAAYVPFRPRQDFVLPYSEDARPGDLPVPPRDLWQGYDNFVEGGAAHTERMLEIVADAGVEFRRGDRILDLGCGAGRMIRHLEPLAGRCEIWGADVNAEHVMWCVRHLSPPFHFLTSTSHPHLPFEDRSFRLVYCGSVFTHIDDLAQAWLLELGRLIAPDGLLYVTIHDEHTLARWERPTRRLGLLPHRVSTSSVRGRAGDAFDMFTVGRGRDSLVFYRRAYFERMASAFFETVATVPEAYGAQTAVVLRRRALPRSD